MTERCHFMPCHKAEIFSGTPLSRMKDWRKRIRAIRVRQLPAAKERKPEPGSPSVPKPSRREPPMNPSPMAIQKRLLARSAFNGISSALPPPHSPKGVINIFASFFCHSRRSVRLSSRRRPESGIFKPRIPPGAGLDPGFHLGYDQKVIFSHIPGFWGKDEGEGA